MQARPEFAPPANLPEALRNTMTQAAHRKWCWVTEDGRAFFVNEERKARNSAAAYGGTVFPPVVH